jgi:hypothetical protein
MRFAGYNRSQGVQCVPCTQCVSCALDQYYGQRSGMLVLGNPARVVRELSDQERASIPALAAKYVKAAAAHAAQSV